MNSSLKACKRLRYITITRLGNILNTKEFLHTASRHHIFSSWSPPLGSTGPLLPTGGCSSPALDTQTFPQFFKHTKLFAISRLAVSFCWETLALSCTWLAFSCSSKLLLQEDFPDQSTEVILLAYSSSLNSISRNSFSFTVLNPICNHFICSYFIGCLFH